MINSKPKKTPHTEMVKSPKDHKTISQTQNPHKSNLGNMAERADSFNFGHNPMKMTPFEKSRVALEVAEREANARKYIRGIQGRDGGCFYDDQEKHELIVPDNHKLNKL